MNKYNMSRMSDKYFKLAGEVNFLDRPKLLNAQLPKAAEYAKIIHDAAYALARELEEAAMK